MSNKDEIIKRIDALDECISKLEITANNFYDPKGELLEGWNTLLKMRDKLKKFSEKEWLKYNNFSK